MLSLSPSSVISLASSRVSFLPELMTFSALNNQAFASFVSWRTRTTTSEEDGKAALCSSSCLNDGIGIFVSGSEISSSAFADHSRNLLRCSLKSTSLSRSSFAMADQLCLKSSTKVASSDTAKPLLNFSNCWPLLITLSIFVAFFLSNASEGALTNLNDLVNHDMTSLNSSAILLSGVKMCMALALRMKLEARGNEFFSATSTDTGVAEPDAPVRSVAMESLLDCLRVTF
mmetsp:Transcript_7535/g.16718  ORF Transcript_7535/g.16718 Transcript_7535/m.16718 type:complete len:230 (+) Transcript_7535:1488-2177(+)